ncbi:MAG: hypothetical protein DIZ80_14325 [endosymbiont of Galathealinum brachiosum]|uniref:cyclic-guanylate-specific phosphodiesterase n=1 Tax=endosymbiont of Galathealinum brachiosum TaxID=2200906 RepID=A0A370D8Q6_9GAMM|nr:MAG: hypothetical protein DIZ80_14325 [endosymbiont of Galathealinum brachiosum]
MSLSLKKTWYGLILLVAVVPALLMLIWGGFLYYQLLLEKHLSEEVFIGELSVDHVKQEVERLATLLENKSDPIAYTLTNDINLKFVDELLHNALKREPAIHVLLLIGTDGKILTGLESYDDRTSPSEERGGLYAHWQSLEGSFSEEFTVPLKGSRFVSNVSIKPEGVFFTLSVPVGPPDKPLAVLLARIDANILWNDLQPHLQQNQISSYLIDSKGLLLTMPADIVYRIGDSLIHIPVVKSFVTESYWNDDEVYVGLKEKKVFGSLSRVENIGVGVITEVNRGYILQPIFKFLAKLVLVAMIFVLIFLWLGTRILHLVITSIDAISADFKRVGKQDYSPSKTNSSFVELSVLVDGFNHMVNEIKHNHHDLEQASVVFDNTSEGILITDASHKIVSVNKSFCEITGYSEDEVIGENPSILKSGHHDESFYKNMWASIDGAGKWRGEVINRRKDGETYVELLSVNTFRDFNGKLTYHIGVFTDISHIKETESKLEYLAHHDQLTGLPNRLLCHARIDHKLQVAKRSKSLVAVLFIDLDMFKVVNDSMGHAQGDVLLQKVGKSLKDHIREEDTIARLGGDEFVITLGSLQSRQDAAHIADNILSIFSRPFLIESQNVFIGASIGISMYPNDGDDTDVLLRNADSAMYKAKADGRNNYQFYTPVLTEEASERLKIINSLRSALEKNEFCVHYQPQYALCNEKIIGVEALIRWDHPEMGMISPAKFIPVAEETGMIIPIGEWVLRTACQQLKQWNDAGYTSIRMAVNLSARQFWKPGLDKVIENILQEFNLKPADLELELTEGIIMHDTSVVIKTLNDIHDMGVRLAVDDFGTGYSSLSYVSRFPLDMLKIDRSFVRDITTNTDDAEMIMSIIALGHSMKLQVLAEGVETREQLFYLKEQGCDEVQGFYFSKPLPANEIEKLLSVK